MLLMRITDPPLVVLTLSVLVRLVPTALVPFSPLAKLSNIDVSFRCATIP